ncbi:recombinase family protein [Hymenobacter wooponensis]|uniref:Recombinase family protein n=1 Tax=Hymenobacter wooponensis TaxID=1525360 RepID=A0A4Z0MD64_9BACT|nr:recombinase family protein [Hymenobacter wooponensis]TGD77175.1 recombinase family protein [Hymenobacter wooponensis]
MLRLGDCVMVNWLSRLGRNTAHFTQLIADFSKNDIRFVALDLGIDTNSPTVRMVLSVFTALAEFERESNRQQRQAGIGLAKAQGKHMGRPTSVD